MTKYKNRLNEKEAQLKVTEHGLVKAKQETTTKLTAVEDEVSSDLRITFSLLDLIGLCVIFTARC